MSKHEWKIGTFESDGPPPRRARSGSILVSHNLAAIAERLGGWKS